MLTELMLKNVTKRKFQEGNKNNNKFFMFSANEAARRRYPKWGGP